MEKEPTMIRDSSGQMENKSEETKSGETEFKLYTKRWFILLIFCLTSMTNSFQWAEYVIIIPQVEYFYNASLPDEKGSRNNYITWTSMIYMLTYIPFVFLFAWFVSKYGLRWCAIMANGLNCVGTWIKVASVNPDLFGVAFFGQCFTGTAQSFILGVPAYQAAIWFGSRELSMATALGVFGNQLGVGLGFLVPPLLVPDPAAILDDKDIMEEMTKGWYRLLVSIASISTVLLILVLLFYKKAPPTPPSKAQLALQEEMQHESDYVQSLKSLMTNPHYCLILLSYGFNTGSYYAIGTLLNLIILDEFPEGEERTKANANVGWIGLTFVLTGLAGSVFAGMCLDKWKKYKWTTLVIYASCLISTLVYTFTLKLRNLILDYITIGVMGFFMTGYLPIGFEFAAEITYPVPEGTSTGLLNCMAQVFGVIMTFAGAYIIPVSVLGFNIMCCAFLGVGTIMMMIVKEDKKRSRAGTKSMSNDVIIGSLTEDGLSPTTTNQVSPSKAK